MSGIPRVRPFPKARLGRLDRSDLELIALSGHRMWLPGLCACASGLARSLGLGAARMETTRVQVLRVEDLRAVFSGQWRFALLKDPVRDRTAFLVLDPLLHSRLVARIRPDRPVQAGWTLSSPGESGAVGWLLASALVKLSEQDPEAFGSWRYFGILETAGDVGRTCCAEDSLVATWLSVEVGWDRGFAVFIEPASSARRRDRSFLDAVEENQLEKIAGLKLSWSVVMGRSVLTTDEIYGIEAGDVILMTEWVKGEQRSLIYGPVTLQGSMQEGALILENMSICEGGATMVAQEVLSNGGNPLLGAADVGSLPVEIVAEAGRVELSVAQIATLAAGDVVTLPDPVLGPVDLRTGLTLVARGELVDVQGRRGVRILEVPPRFGARDENV